MLPLLAAIASMNLPADAQRIFHGRGGLHPECAHLSLDFFPPVWVLTSFQPLSDEKLAAIGAALKKRCEQLLPGDTLNWVCQCRNEGQSSTHLMGGSIPDPHWVTEEGVLYRVNVGRGQDHGLFLDMAEGRRWCVHT